MSCENIFVPLLTLNLGTTPGRNLAISLKRNKYFLLRCFEREIFESQNYFFLFCGSFFEKFLGPFLSPRKILVFRLFYQAQKSCYFSVLGPGLIVSPCFGKLRIFFAGFSTLHGKFFGLFFCLFLSKFF